MSRRCEDQDRLYALFQEARSLPLDEIEEFLATRCSRDEGLELTLRELLEHHHAAERDDPAPFRRQSRLEVGDRLGPYQIQRLLGEGGMGVVFLAEQQQPVRRLVALKLISARCDGQALVRLFELERQALALMNHEGIARIYDAGTTRDGRPYFVMEYVDGLPITTFCEEQRLPMVQRLELFVQSCQAVEHAHRRGIIHRDLKPSNLLVAEIDGQPIAKVIDFGIARAVRDQESALPEPSSPTEAIGTWGYMSPEQAERRHEDVGTHSDVYSLGVVLYELLCGILPYDPARFARHGKGVPRVEELPAPSVRFRGRTAEERQRHAASMGVRENYVRRALEQEMDWIIRKAMATEPAERYSSAQELADDMSRFLANRPIHARPLTRSHWLRKWIKRNALLAAAVVLLLLGITAGLVGVTIASYLAFQQSILARQNETKAMAEADRARRALAEQQLEEMRTRTWQSAMLANLAVGQLHRGDTTTALHLALLALPQDPDAPDRPWLPEAESVLYRAAARDREAEVKAIDVGTVRHIEVDRRATRILTLTRPGGGSGSTSPQQATIWNLESKTPVVRIPETATAAAVTNDGASLIVCGEHDVSIWDVKTGKQRGTAPLPSMSKDRLVLGTARALLSRWAPEGGRFRVAIPGKPTHSGSEAPSGGEAHESWPAVYDAHAGLVATMTASGAVRLWSWDTGAPRDVPIPLPDAGVRYCAFDRSGTRLIVCGEHPQARIWDLRTRAQPISLHGHEAAVTCAAFNSAGDRVVTGSADRTLRLWDAATGKQIAVLAGHSDRVCHVEFSADGRTIVSASSDDTIRLWRTETDLFVVSKSLFACPWELKTSGERVLAERMMATIRKRLPRPFTRRDRQRLGIPAF